MKNISIAWHEIELWVDVTDVEGLENDSNLELSEISKEHILNSIIEWYVEWELNELVYSDNDEEWEECRWWWKIIS